MCDEALPEVVPEAVHAQDVERLDTNSRYSG